MALEKTTYEDETRADSTSSRIQQVAVRLFAKKGYDGTSTKEICQEAGVNIAAIHYHFGSKERLLRAILESFGGQRMISVQRILAPPANAEEFRVRLKMYLTESYEFFVQQPDLFRIVQAEAELMHKRSEMVFRTTFLKICSLLTEFLEIAKRKKFIGKDIDPLIAARCLYSQIAHQTRTDEINQKFYGTSLKDESYREKWVSQSLAIFLNGVDSK